MLNKALLQERVVRRCPGIVDRLEGKTDCVFLVDPVNLPFAFLLRVHPTEPMLVACRRESSPHYDARIAATVLTLMDLADGTVDGDALFFTRDLIVEGDTEAVVCLRNAMDDQASGVLDEVADCFGLAGNIALSRLRNIRRKKDGSHQVSSA
jgi:predicted lipid carrier protein YhbT